MKKILLMIMALWLSVMGVAQTAQEVVIGEEYTRTYSSPHNTASNYGSYSQQLYYPDEIGTFGYITSISFYKVSGPELTRDVQLFMKLTERQDFDLPDAMDWEIVTTDDIVYEGDYFIPEGDNLWITITLDKPFYYDGSNNLMVGFFDRTVSTSSSVSYKCNGSHTLLRSKINGYSFQTPAYNPFNIHLPHDWEGYHINNACYWNSIKLTIMLATGAIVEVTPDMIDFGDVPNNAWKHSKDVQIKNTGLSGTLTGVDATGDYFTVTGENTPVEMPTGSQFSYQVSANGTALGAVNENLMVMYSDSDRDLIAVPLTANAYNPVCPDVYELAQNVSSFPYSDVPNQLHNIYQLPGENEDGPDAVYKMTFSSDVMLTANVENGANPKVALYAEDFNGGDGPHSDNAYTGPALPEPTEPLSEWLYYDDDFYTSSVGGENGISFGIKFTPEQLQQYEGCLIERVRIYDHSNEQGQIDMNIYFGGEESPDRLLSSQSFHYSYTLDWLTLELENPILLDVNKSLWVVFHTDEVLYPAPACDYCGDPNSCLLSLDGEEWAPVVNSGLDLTWMIRAFVTNENGSREIGSEGEINQMTVEAGTYYLVASSTDEGFQVNINAETIPLPEIACNPLPANGANSVMHPLKIKWSFGEYTTGYRLLFGSTYPPQDVVVDWTDDLNAEYITGLLYNNTQYFWRVDERNSSGYTQGEVWGFTTTLDVPKEFSVENDKLYEGDTAVLHWEAPIDRSFRSYNVYQDNVLIGNTTATTFLVGNLLHNSNGYQFAVTAVYDEGESAKTDPLSVQVTGMGMISGSVVEQDMVTPIAGATVKLSGVDELGFPQHYEFATNENGLYDGELYSGTYSVAALKDGYQNAYWETPVTIQYQSTMADVNFMMSEVYAPVGRVLAEDLDTLARITWDNNPQPMEPQWLYYDNGYNCYNVGSGLMNFYWGVSFPEMNDYAGTRLTKVAYYDAAGTMSRGAITINIYLGGISAPQRLVSSQDFSTYGSGSFLDINLTTPVEIDGTEPLWITCYCNSMLYPASASPNYDDANGRWCSNDGINWMDVNLSGPSNIMCTWMLRGLLEEGDGNERSLQYYNVYRSDCYNEETAELIASNIADTSFIDVAWNAFEPGVYKWGVSKTYQGNRAVNEMVALLDEDFEGGTLPNGWSTSGAWTWTVANSLEYTSNVHPHNSNYAAFCNSDGDCGSRYLVTPAIDLSLASSASLDFYYVLPDWGGDWDDLRVKYSTSSTGPWTNLWTAPSETWTWTEKTIDLAALCGGVYYLAFVDVDWYGYGSAVDDVKVMADVYVPNLPHESEIIWSNCLDKDMTTLVEVQVTTNNATSPEGTQVSLFNISEPDMGYDYETVLDETGYYVWDGFHKGTYRYSIKRYGYESCADGDTIVIWEDTDIQCMLEEIVHSVEDLYVSPTGWAKWSGDFKIYGDEFYYDFEDGTMGDWTLIDANDDGYNWNLGMQGGNPSIAGHNSNYCVYSESYRASVGGILPDNYLVSRRVTIGSGAVFSFYVCAQDNYWPEDHFGVAISTTGNANPNDFTTIWEETLVAKSGKGVVEGPKGTRTQGNWYYKEIDLSAYAGQQVYIALRHFDCYDEFCINVDDIRLSNGRQSKDPMGYKVLLDGVYVTDTEDTYLQHDVSNLVPGQTYTTSVAAVYATGMSEWETYEWTYVPCDEFAGADNLAIEEGSSAVTLHWNLPLMEQKKESRDGQWYYYDDGVNLDAIGTSTGASIYWAVMFPAGQFEGNKLRKVSMYNFEGAEHEGKIMIYQGGSTTPEELLYTQPYEATGVNSFVEYELNESVEIDDTRNLWIVMNNTTGTYVASCCQNTGNNNGRWISMDGTTWNDIQDYGLSCTWMLRAYLEVENVDGILGTMVWRDGELITEEPVTGESFTDYNAPENLHEYCIRVVHDGMPDSTYYAMSCELCEQVLITAVTGHESAISQIYPNPTKGELTIKAADMTHIRIVSVLGQVIYDQDVNCDEKTLNLNDGSGVYVVYINTANGNFIHRVVVVDP